MLAAVVSAGSENLMSLAAELLVPPLLLLLLSSCWSLGPSQINSNNLDAMLLWLQLTHLLIAQAVIYSNLHSNRRSESSDGKGPKIQPLTNLQTANYLSAETAVVPQKKQLVGDADSDSKVMAFADSGLKRMVAANSGLKVMLIANSCS